MTGIPIHTSLRNAASSPMNREELERLKTKAWLDFGIIVVEPHEINHDYVRQGLVNEIIKKRGRRMKPGKR